MKMVQGMVGEKGKAYVPYLTTVMLYIGVSNIIGLFGFKSPTKDLRVTVALALMSIILIEAAGIYHKGVKRWLHGFVEPVAIVTPINILEVVTKPLSLCMRLFGNVLGAFVIMELLKMILPVGLPVVFSLYFDIFDGLLQAQEIVFPDLSFRREADGRTIHLELFHRWHRGQLDRRLALLEQKPDMQLLVGVDRALADDAAWKVLETDHPALAGRLFRFRDFPGVDRVRRVLDAFAETNSGEKKRCRKSMRT